MFKQLLSNKSKNTTVPNSNLMIPILGSIQGLEAVAPAAPAVQSTVALH
jgi:hypothetical protein